jgi:hypothetical protein
LRRFCNLSGERVKTTASSTNNSMNRFRLYKYKIFSTFEFMLVVISFRINKQTSGRFSLLYSNI